MRGVGLGKRLVLAGMELVGQGLIEAEIKDNNAASQRVFIACGFRRVCSVSEESSLYIAKGAGVGQEDTRLLPASREATLPANSAAPR